MRLFGHPLHPAMVHFPIAFWSLATVCDGLAYFGLAETWAHGWVLIGLGLAIGLVAMAAGFMELTRLAEEAQVAAQRHMMTMGLAWICYLGALMSRLQDGTPIAEPAMLPVALSAVGFVLLLIGGWLGGNLVYRYGAGREETPRMQ
ncbi:DUF2231 domain-containing protein [Allosphingosinicella humi]